MPKQKLSKEISNELNEYIKKYFDTLTYEQIADKFRQYGVTSDAVRKRRIRLNLPPKCINVQNKDLLLPVDKQVERDIYLSKIKEGKKQTDRKYNFLIEQIKGMEREIDAIRHIGTISSYTIEPKTRVKDECTAVALASDWHIEEPVALKQVNGLNEYSLQIAHSRSDEFFQQTLEMALMYQANTLILALLGDFISNSIHDELMEENELSPIEATITAQNMIISGIQFLLDNYDGQIVVPCHSGNHARTTKKQRSATEAGNSLEYFMYHNIANYFRHEERLSFLIPESYHSYVDVYGYTIRFHHGHSIRYGGGVGGVFIPAYKAISQWNKGNVANLDCFGHFHQFKDGGNFITNGSLIGYNAYAISIKAEFEKPKQVFFIVEKGKGKTATVPILFTK